MNLWHYELSSPLGPMRAAFDGQGRLQELALEGLDPRKTSPLPPREQRIAKRFLDRQLDAYLAGTLRTFTVPVDPRGNYQQLKIWDAIMAIPYGETRTPLELATRLGLEEELVVMGCVANPIALLIPAHRVLVPGDGPIAQALRDIESGLGWRKH
jgi:O6-methylguanine-DNA--protein-cysteine methyltransferase